MPPGSSNSATRRPTREQDRLRREIGRGRQKRAQRAAPLLFDREEHAETDDPTLYAPSPLHRVLLPESSRSVLWDRETCQYLQGREYKQKRGRIFIRPRSEIRPNVTALPQPPL